MEKEEQHKTTTPLTRSSTRAATTQAKEDQSTKGKRKDDIAGLSMTSKKLKRKLKPQEEIDYEKTESNDIIQFIVVIHNHSSNIENLYDNIKNYVELSGFLHVDFDKLGSGDKNNIEEAFYDMMTTFKTTTLEISQSITKILYERVEKKWKSSLTSEKQIREATSTQVMPTLDKKMIAISF